MKSNDSVNISPGQNKVHAFITVDNIIEIYKNLNLFLFFLKLPVRITDEEYQLH